jgi:hypothetical protein
MAAGFPKLIPASSLVNPQTGQVRGGSYLEPGGLDRVGAMMLSIFAHDRSVPRELELGESWCLAFHRDRLAHDFHDFPSALVSIA